MALTPSQTKKLLEELGHSPRKKLGQNYLIDPNCVRKHLQMANLQRGDWVVEVGPGLGTLTETLLEAGAKVWAVELDKRMAAHLRSRLLPVYGEQLHLLEADAVEAPLAGLPQEEGSSFSILANLPYAIATPWIAAVLAAKKLPQQMVLMLQKEAADRFVATAGTKACSAITVRLQGVFEKVDQHSVPPHAFFPPPKVQSCLLHLRLKQEPYRFKPETVKRMQAFFNQRRKQLGHLIKKVEAEGPSPSLLKWKDYLEGAGVPLTARPEELRLEDWIALDQMD